MSNERGFFSQSYWNPAVSVGLSMSWNLFNGFKNLGKMGESQANLKKARIMYEQESVQNEMKVRKARRVIEEARQNITLTETAIEQAEEDFRIRSDRFDEGLEQSSDVLQTEAKRMEARLRNLQAIFQYNMGVATLELLYETDFN
jgi:outer membrane protein TolC